MTAEQAFVFTPLILLVAGAVVDELRSGLIRDVVTLPALLYMLVVRAVLGPDRWYLYLVAAASVAVAFVAVPRLVMRRDWIGYGAVKLLAVVAAALGFRDGWLAAGAFVLLAVVCLAIARRREQPLAIPSSPLIVVALLVVFIARALSSGA